MNDIFIGQADWHIFFLAVLIDSLCERHDFDLSHLRSDLLDLGQFWSLRSGCDLNLDRGFLVVVREQLLDVSYLVVAQQSIIKSSVPSWQSLFAALCPVNRIPLLFVNVKHICCISITLYFKAIVTAYKMAAVDGTSLKTSLLSGEECLAGTAEAWVTTWTDLFEEWVISDLLLYWDSVTVRQHNIFKL